MRIALAAEMAPVIVGGVTEIEMELGRRLHNPGRRI